MPDAPISEDQLREEIARLVDPTFDMEPGCPCESCAAVKVGDREFALTKADAILALVRRAPDPQAEGGWLPIETAPRDGTDLLLLVDGVVCEGVWQGASDGAIYSRSPSRYNWFNRSAGCSEADGAVTNWMPLPNPPRTALQGGEEEGENDGL